MTYLGYKITKQEGLFVAQAMTYRKDGGSDCFRTLTGKTLAEVKAKVRNV